MTTHPTAPVSRAVRLLAVAVLVDRVLRLLNERRIVVLCSDTGRGIAVQCRQHLHRELSGDPVGSHGDAGDGVDNVGDSAKAVTDRIDRICDQRDRILKLSDLLSAHLASTSGVLSSTQSITDGLRARDDRGDGLGEIGSPFEGARHQTPRSSVAGTPEGTARHDLDPHAAPFGAEYMTTHYPEGGVVPPTTPPVVEDAGATGPHSSPDRRPPAPMPDAPVTLTDKEIESLSQWLPDDRPYLVDTVVAQVEDILAARHSGALWDAADAFQWGGWTVLTEPVKQPEVTQRALGGGQAVVQWLRERASETRPLPPTDPGALS